MTPLVICPRTHGCIRERCFHGLGSETKKEMCGSSLRGEACVWLLASRGSLRRVHAQP